MSLLEHLIVLNILSFILVFVRLGTVVMIMPGVGDSFVPANIRLYFALALSVIMTPIVATYLPHPMPGGAFLLILILMEFLVGAFIGTVSRIFMSATDTAGMIVSTQAGLANAQLFNPQLATQGSLMGAFFSISAATLLFTLNLHHILIMGLIESYQRFPLGEVPDPGSMADMIARSVAAAFSIAMQMAAPFLVIILILYAAMGVLARLMPQLQIFILSLPVQILLSLFALMLVGGTMLMYFADQFGAHVGTFLGG